MLMACALGAPLICVLLHAAQERRWPAMRGAMRGVRLARPLAWVLLGGWMLLIGLHANSLALALTLPLAALSVAGLFYVPCVRAWPRPTVLLSLGITATGLLLGAAA